MFKFKDYPSQSCIWQSLLNICVEDPNFSYYGETDRQLKIMSDICISSFTMKKTKPANGNSIQNHLFNVKITLLLTNLCMEVKSIYLN